MERWKSFYRQRPRLTLGLGVAAATALLLGIASFSRSGNAQYFTSEVERGDIQSVVNATGTINAVTTVLVGSQVSGNILELYADFNDRVRRGQVIARLDPAIFQTRVLQAEADLANAEAGVKSTEADLLAAQANLEKARADARVAELNQQRTLKLFEQGIASVEQRDTMQATYDTAIANLQAAEAQITQTRARLDQQKAQVKQRRAALEQARLDLEHTIIRAPIDGTVIARNVDVGQTVAASLQAPTLFTIAQDLTQMLVYAKTDESDVGRIPGGAEAQFKVDSFPNRTFRGRVKQVRMNAYTVQNVVTYDTIIEFENADLKLLPGMTAYVEIPVASMRDVVKIPNGALRFTPDLPEPERTALLRKYGLLGPARTGGAGTAEASTGGTSAPQGGQSGGTGSDDSRRAQMRERWQNASPEERARLRTEMQARRAAAGGGGEGSGGGRGGQGRPTRGPGAEGAVQIVWKLNPDHTLLPVRVKTGLTDFTYTALVEGDLKPGDKLVIGQTLTQRPATAGGGRPMGRF
jgi:HlyD family secretion protein